MMTLGNSLQEIADELNLSVMSVSRALHGRGGVSEETRQRVRSAAESAGYRPNHVARALLTGRTRTVGILAPSRSASVVAKLDREFRKRGLQILPSFCEEGGDADAGLIASLLARRVDGIVLVEQDGGFASEVYENITREGLPLVVATTAPAGGSWPHAAADCDRVCIDSSRTAASLARHYLTGQGRERIVALGFDYPSEIQTCRYDDAVQTPSSKPVQILPVSRTVKGVEAAVIELLHRDPRIDAFIAPDEISATGVLRACRQHGRRIGRRLGSDIALICEEDTSACSLFDPAVTAAKIPLVAIAARCVELLANHLERPASWEPQEISFSAELVLRESA